MWDQQMGEKPVQQDQAGQRKAFHYTVLPVKKKATRPSVHLSTGCLYHSYRFQDHNIIAFKSSTCKNTLRISALGYYLGGNISSYQRCHLLYQAIFLLFQMQSYVALVVYILLYIRVTRNLVLLSNV